MGSYLAIHLAKSDQRMDSDYTASGSFASDPAQRWETYSRFAKADPVMLFAIGLLFAKEAPEIDRPRAVKD